MPKDYVDEAAELSAMWRQGRKSETLQHVARLTGIFGVATVLQVAEQLEGSGLRAEFIRHVYSAAR